METKLSIFEGKEIRKVWDSTKGDWFFSVVDIIEVLTESPRPRKYWNDLKSKLIDELKKASQKGGKIAGDTRKNIESQTGKKVISKTNFLDNKNKLN